MNSKWRFLSVPPATHERDWWPTPHWVLRRLAMYATAALSGGLLFVFCAALLALFSPRTPINHAIPTQNRSHIVSPTAPSSPSANSVHLIAIMTLLENKDDDPVAIRQFINRSGFEQKYPLGFAIFYSNGAQRTLHYVRSKQSVNGISFDPSILKVYRDGIWYCLNLLPIRINGSLMTNVRNICLGGNRGVMHAARVVDVQLDIEPLATSPEGAAWIIGMRPLTP